MKIFIVNVIVVLSLLANSAYAVEFDTISSVQLKEIANDDADIKLVFFFTSWCGVCKSSLQDLFALSEKYKTNPRVKIIPVSIDDNQFLIYTYVKNLPKSIAHKVYHFSHSNSYEAVDMFKNLNIHYRGSIPHVALFGKKGEVIVDGNYKVSSFSVGIDRLLERK